MSLYSFLETCQEQGRALVMSKTFQLEPEVSREHFDKVFDAHWHNGFIIRHLIYKQSKGENSISVLDKSP